MVNLRKRTTSASKDVFNYFDEGDAFIFNDTKVFPARLYGTKEKTDAKIEVFLLRELNQRCVFGTYWLSLHVRFVSETSFSLMSLVRWWLRLLTIQLLVVAHFVSFTTVPHDEFKRELFALGEAPLPRYIIDNRPKEDGEEFAHATADDMEHFQSVFAKNEGAVSAPGTNIHFSGTHDEDDGY